TPAKRFIIVDAGMNDLIRPSLYEAHHEIYPVKKVSALTLVKTADIVGPICESGDFLAKNRQLPAIEGGELLSVMSAGAYGFSMSSNYNSRRRAAEIMVSGNRYFLIRRRENFDDLVRLERVINIPRNKK
ncbi:MAG TPA: diaminopimelate decarboxylase, partial [Candidatus Omnitrophota bacterium]|nr:diaminopimelate decarboxylase [Candidatus Omnitrophota bacterium]